MSGEERREQILGFAREEFLNRGLAGARVQDVADAAGVNIALVYKHFPSKDELFEQAVMSPLRDRLTGLIEEIRELPVDPEGRASIELIREFFLTLLTTFTESVEEIGVVLFGHGDHSQAVYSKHVRPLIDAAVEASKTTLGRWPSRTYDVDIAMQATFGMAFWVALDRSMRGRKESLDQIAEQLADILFHGISES
jgi:AcrR family transcriptional regulator